MVAAASVGGGLGLVVTASVRGVGGAQEGTSKHVIWTSFVRKVRSENHLPERSSDKRIHVRRCYLYFFCFSDGLCGSSSRPRCPT